MITLVLIPHLPSRSGLSPDRRMERGLKYSLGGELRGRDFKPGEAGLQLWVPAVSVLRSLCPPAGLFTSLTRPIRSCKFTSKEARIGWEITKNSILGIILQASHRWFGLAGSLNPDRSRASLERKEGSSGRDEGLGILLTPKSPGVSSSGV